MLLDNVLSISLFNTSKYSIHGMYTLWNSVHMPYMAIWIWHYIINHMSPPCTTIAITSQERLTACCNPICKEAINVLEGVYGNNRFNCKPLHTSITTVTAIIYLSPSCRQTLPGHRQWAVWSRDDGRRMRAVACSVAPQRTGGGGGISYHWHYTTNYIVYIHVYMYLNCLPYTHTHRISAVTCTSTIIIHNLQHVWCIYMYMPLTILSAHSSHACTHSSHSSHACTHSHSYTGAYRCLRLIPRVRGRGGRACLCCCHGYSETAGRPSMFFNPKGNNASRVE